jgi:hypothetical protein
VWAAVMGWSLPCNNTTHCDSCPRCSLPVAGVLITLHPTVTVKYRYIPLLIRL